VCACVCVCPKEMGGECVLVCYALLLCLWLKEQKSTDVCSCVHMHTDEDQCASICCIQCKVICKNI
jgi:hypothetical protein